MGECTGTGNEAREREVPASREHEATALDIEVTVESRRVSRKNQVTRPGLGDGMRAAAVRKDAPDRHRQLPSDKHSQRRGEHDIAKKGQPASVGRTGAHAGIGPRRVEGDDVPCAESEGFVAGHFQGSEGHGNIEGDGRFRGAGERRRRKARRLVHAIRNARWIPISGAAPVAVAVHRPLRSGCRRGKGIARIGIGVELGDVAEGVPIRVGAATVRVAFGIELIGDFPPVRHGIAIIVGQAGDGRAGHLQQDAVHDRVGAGRGIHHAEDELTGAARDNPVEVMEDP